MAGSCGLVTNKGLLLHRDTTEEEMKKAEEILKVKGDIGTANFGTPYVGTSGMANSKGLVIGEKTSGPEISRAVEALDLI